ncbi:ribonuclease III [endosymbiont of Pachyrhynchus infernalis]|uniref:ribonuclease III n=1 Tax=endosymbiont of Pachyrhynchus infernalis TaxID=1971488 RepID=UPI000DC6E299|nr:ribonuclease III [endosymbiont of Pachyrhynchus infernalis]BBA84786.1 ribonuclease 3 [endosymbiont of Pachyrhynchus infernalis]
MKFVELEDKLNYYFKNKDLLFQSLSHKSIGSFNNEKLEFLGDSVLNFIITTNIYNIFNDLNEGDMSYIRSNLIQSKNLIKIAKKLNIKNYIQFSSVNDKIDYFINYLLANSLEAIIGAIFLDGGIESVKKFIFSQFNENLNKLKNNRDLNKDFKTLLQELLQKLHFSLPIYDTVKIKNYKYNLKKFYILCKISNPKYIETNGIGLNKKQAEQIAAKKMLKLLNYNFNKNI